eukprot:CAMPEP_0182528562 /NCGR_PEP_ID=MMETSP1323-20130603/4587_1 /TAXON_ID=236787 /ORGANISM="Florenciella parvula, Strain RCC1693" /LENGTH=155 /DNA_ID=CAMNT_0024737691 /DNA_START=214 /DNA_END=681 /DNA_ORIENTATION=+
MEYLTHIQTRSSGVAMIGQTAGLLAGFEVVALIEASPLDFNGDVANWVVAVYATISFAAAVLLLFVTYRATTLYNKLQKAADPKEPMLSEAEDRDMLNETNEMRCDFSCALCLFALSLIWVCVVRFWGDEVTQVVAPAGGAAIAYVVHTIVSWRD